MSDFDRQATVTAKELHDLAAEWQQLPDELKNHITNNSLFEVDQVINNWLDELGVKKTWGHSLHPADVLDKLVFPQLVERLNSGEVEDE